MSDRGELRPTALRAANAIGHVRLISMKDIVEIGRIPVSAVIAWCVPERSWPRFGRCLALATVRLNPGRTRSNAQRLRRVMGDIKEPKEFVAMEIDRISRWNESRIQGLGEYRPGGWTPEIQVLGAEHVEAALDRGRGAVLWIGEFVFGSLVAKMALHRTGWRVSHLSRPAHGYSRTRFGIRVLNPLWTRIEDRYLGERIVLRQERPNAALRALRRRLKNNGVVSITVGDQGLKTLNVPFLQGQLKLATGPATLSRDAKAPLLPVFAAREKSGVFTVAIGPPLDVSADKDKQDYLEAALTEYANRLEPYVLAHPCQWQGWRRCSASESG